METEAIVLAGSSRKEHKMGKRNQKYLDNVATMVAGRCQIRQDSRELDPTLPKPNSWNFAKKFWGLYGSQVMAVIAKMTPEARGRIAACGAGARGAEMDPTPHWEMEEDLNERQTANELLTKLAAMVVIAAIVDKIAWDLYNQEYEEAGPHLY